MSDVARVPGAVVNGCRAANTQIVGLRVGARATEAVHLPRVVDAQLRNVEIGGAVVQWVVFERCTFENISGPTLTLSGLFSECRLVGRFGRIMFRDVVLPESDRETFSSLRRSFYSRPSTWALDISGAEFLEFDCRNIPGDRIRRNEAAHGLMTRAAAQAAVAAPTLQSNPWRRSIERKLAGDLLSWVLVPPRGPNGAELRDALKALRAEGYAA